MTMTHLVDLHASVNRPGALAQRSSFDSGLPLPAGASVISRNAPIQVVGDSGQPMGVITKVGSEDIPRPVPTYAARPPGSYPEGMGPAAMGAIEAVPQPDVRPAITVRHELPQPDQLVQSVITSVNPAAQAPVAAAPVVRSKTKVRLSNPGMGKITTFVDGLGVSDSLVILAYLEDGTANIVEPPDCTEDNPVIIEAAGKVYRCLYGGWTATLDGRMLVVLVRLPD